MAQIVEILRNFLICDDFSFVKPSQTPKTYRELCVNLEKVEKIAPISSKLEEKPAISREIGREIPRFPQFPGDCREICANCNETRAEIRQIREIFKEKGDFFEKTAIFGQLLKENVDLKLRFLEIRQVSFDFIEFR